MSEIKTYKAYLKEYINLGLPMMIGSLAVVFISSGDTMMISRLGSNVTLAAAQLANQICNVPFLFLIGNSSILAPIVASLVVNKNYEDATRSLQHVVVINLCFAVFSTATIIGFSSMLGSFGQPEEVVLEAKEYLWIIALSIIPDSISYALKRYLDALTWTIHTTILGIASGILNVCLNYLLIGGELGFPALGLNGAGWATLITRVVVLGIYGWYLFVLRKRGLIISFSNMLFSKSYFIRIFKLGFPSGLDLAVKMSYYAIAIFMFGQCSNSEVAQASTGILFGILRFALMLPLAVCSSASILVSRSWARKNKPAILRLAQTGYAIAFILIIGMAGVVYMSYPMLYKFYKPTDHVKQLITSVMWLILLFQFVDGLNLVSLGMLRGLQDTLVPFLLSAFAYIGIGLPASYIGAYHFNYEIYGIWFGLIFGLTASVCFLSLRFYYKLRHLKLPHHYTRL